MYNRGVNAQSVEGQRRPGGKSREEAGGTVDVFREILRFNLRRLMGNVWLWLAVLASTVFVIVFGADKLLGERSGLQFVIGFNHVNMVFPLVVLGHCVWFVNEAVHGKVSGLLDSYSYRNHQMFLGVFTSLLLTFWLLATAQFLLISLTKALLYSSFSQPGWSSILWFFPFSFCNVLLLASVATVVGMVFKETLLGYLVVFSYQVFNLLLDKFSPRHLQWFTLLHTNLYKYDNYSVFARLGLETQLFLLNRLGVLATGLVAITVACLLFKRSREQKKTYLVFALLGSSACLGLCLLAFGRVNGFPVKAAANLAEKVAFEQIPLELGPFEITGVHEAGSIRLSTRFLVRNTSKQAVPLGFYLARSFAVLTLHCAQEPVPFNRTGDLVATAQDIAADCTVLCEIDCEGSICEYVKLADSFWDYTHRSYAYSGPELIFVPGCAGWYPSAKPILNYVPELQWIYPSREQNKGNVSLRVEGDFPIVADQNIVYGYPDLECSTFDGVRYYHSRKHAKSIEAFHQLVVGKLALLQELIPDTRVQIFEVPQNLATADLMIENGFGRIMIGEATLVAAASGETSLDYPLERTLFSGWFNLSNLGFESHPPHSNQGGALVPFLPGLSFGGPDAFILFNYFQYIFRAENDLSFDAQARTDYLLRQKSELREVGDRFLALEKSVAHYEKHGLVGARQLFTHCFELEQHNSLTGERLVQYLEEEWGE